MPKIHKLTFRELKHKLTHVPEALSISGVAWAGPNDPRTTPVPRKAKLEQTATSESFGARMARLRKAAGFSQRDLAKELGVSQRMVAYYEAHSEHPPAHLLPALVTLFSVTTDELLGLRPPRPARPVNARLLHRMRQVEKLPPKQKKHLLALIDAFIEREAFAKKAS
jgi:transcriptional regulator with XRE-family HTH domain